MRSVALLIFSLLLFGLSANAQQDMRRLVEDYLERDLETYNLTLIDYKIDERYPKEIRYLQGEFTYENSQGEEFTSRFYSNYEMISTSNTLGRRVGKWFNEHTGYRFFNQSPPHREVITDTLSYSSTEEDAKTYSVEEFFETH